MTRLNCPTDGAIDVCHGCLSRAAAPIATRPARLVELRHTTSNKRNGYCARALFGTTAVALLLSASDCPACNIPVFRFALENWQPEAYRFVILHNGARTPSQQKLLRWLEEQAESRANILVQRVETVSLLQAGMLCPPALPVVGALPHSFSDPKLLVRCPPAADSREI